MNDSASSSLLTKSGEIKKPSHDYKSAEENNPLFLCIITHMRPEKVYMNSIQIIRLLEDDGWKQIRINGSHHHFKHPAKKGLVTVPHPKKDLPAGTVNSILKQAGLK